MSEKVLLKEGNTNLSSDILELREICLLWI